MAKKEKGLNVTQQRFCIEYLTHFNATQAAIRAGYSKKTAYSIGEENLKKPEIQAEISKQVDVLLEQAKVPLKKQIFEFWMKRAFYDITEIISPDGEMQMTSEQLREKGLHVCIDSINKKINSDGEIVITYKFADKDKAVEMLQRYIQMIKEQVEVSGSLQLIKITEDEAKALR